MSAEAKGSSLLAKFTDVGFALMLCGILFLLIFKLPTWMLDMLLVLSISAAFLVMLMTIYVDRPLKLSSFPSMLLILTLFRLGLNVSSTKLILLERDAGSIIESFGNFVIQGNYIVGAVIFLILTMIQFKVISEGSGRIAEVSARFTLDAMPGKQMSIDADLNAGVIDESEAQRRRIELNDEAAFYGSMDGANKFVKGDVMAGLLITIINIVGGITIGVVQNDLPLVEAVKVYTILTIGDGLVSQIPSLIIALSAGILVTRNGKSGGLGPQLGKELFANPLPLFVCSFILGAIAVLPGLPFWPFAIFSIACFFIGNFVVKKDKVESLQAIAQEEAMKHKSEQKESMSPESKSSILPDVSPMSLEIGFSLVPLVDKEQGGDLIERISNIRKQIFDDFGFRIPPISVKDNIDLESNEYRILVRGVENTRATVQVNSHLAINPGDAMSTIDGVETQDPAFGFAAYWISPKNTEMAERQGYTVVDSASVITTHITKVVRDNAERLLSRQTVADMLEKLKEKAPAIVEETVPDLLSISVLHRVMQSLLEEQVPVHDLQTVLETTADCVVKSSDPIVLAEYVRQALKGHITANLIEENNTLYCLTISPQLENEISSSLQQNESIGILSLAPQRAAEIVGAICHQAELCRDQMGTELALLTTPMIRKHLFNLLKRQASDLPVLSYAEISDELNVEILGSVMPVNSLEQMDGVASSGELAGASL